jgi:deoxyribodipyrimidine photo-lyase
MSLKIAIFWYRRDLRLNDNAALYHALRNEIPVLPIFIFDRQILDKLENRADKRVVFIYQQIQQLQLQLAEKGSMLLVKYGNPIEIWKELISLYDITDVYANHDYEPYALARDKAVKELLHEVGISFHTFKDQCIFEKDEVVKDDGKPYTVFTPYSRKWRTKLDIENSDFYLKSYPTEKYFHHFVEANTFFQAYPSALINSKMVSLEEMNFKGVDVVFPDEQISEKILNEYAEKRDIPSIQGTTRLSVHLRFGTISIREAARKGVEKSEKWLNELIWRDFYMMILYHFPHSATRAFNSKYDLIVWRNDPSEFEAWCEGRTGYPIVDAGMRELNATGFMHNRVRMITAGFLTKHLLIDWRWGEAYFAQKLLDFDLAANNGGWQWAAGTGCDAAPYFRIFNPAEQTKKFDPQLIYIKKWVPDFSSFHYPKPIVEHKFARERCLKTYQDALVR